MSKQPMRIQHVAVLGSGVMGSQIAAHCVNAGLDVWLLDLKNTDGDDPNATVRENLKKLKKMKPAPFGLPDYAERIQVGNFEDDLDRVLKEVDWVCEAVVERMDIKKQMMARIAKARSEGTIVSTNTSGLPIHQVCAEQSDEFKAHFLGTHFFNPPRYMKLLELIPTDDTADAILDFMHGFAEKTLGKGVVTCKDTPNFIANRIGVFSMASIMPWFFEGKLRAEEIDFLTGTLTGYSKAATFRTADMAGLDVLNHVAENLYPAVPDDERREVFKLPDTFKKMVDEGMIGNKAGKGFYQKVKTEAGKAYHVVDPDSMEYEPQVKPEFESAAEAKKKFPDAGERLKFLVQQDDEAGRFLWEIHCELLLYSANRIPEITDSVEAIDRAMRWGFNWELGPFERWDALGVEETVKRMQEEGREVPGSVLDMLESGRKRFYNYEAGTVYNLATGKEEALPPPAAGALLIKDLQAGHKEVTSNEHAALYDMGEGVALFEFRTPMNTLGTGLVGTLAEAFETVTADFDALVISNESENFSYGANLKEVLVALQQDQKAQLRRAVKQFQDVSVGLRYLPVPVVVAPFGRSLGGGTEFTMHADKVVAHHELYSGLVEVGVGLLPAGGGTTELLRRYMKRVADDEHADPLPYLKEAFKVIGMAKVSDGAPKAKELGYLGADDLIVMNRDLLIAAAKKQAKALAESGYRPPARPRIKLMGRTGFAALKLMTYSLFEAGFATEYDRVVAEKVAEVLTGGDLSEAQKVPEDYVLKLEREGFLELLEDQRTVKRIEHMLKTGKPLRN